MKYIKSIIAELTEGAALIPPTYDRVELNWLDDKTKPLEVLKTNNVHSVAGFRDKIGNTKGGSFQIYYGLTVDPRRNAKLSNADPVFKITMDLLKSSDIVDKTKSLVTFTSKTAAKIADTKRKVDYIIPLGSTKGLSPDLATAFSYHFKNAEIIPLRKYKFNNISAALDWEYIQEYEARAREEGGPRSILTRVKNEILRALDQDKTEPQLIQEIKDAQTPEELKGLILRSDPKNRYYKFGSPQFVWKDPEYQIRSSGLQFGGSRRFFKTKYETPKTSGEFASPEFTEAVISCILTEKTMLFVDDNTRTKEDLSKIFDSVIAVAAAVLPKEKLTEIESKYFKRFLAYVLIYVPESGGERDERDITVKKLAGENDVTQFRGALSNFEDWIKSNR